MSNQKKTHELIRQNEKLVEKSQKHDVNLQKNSTLYFQVGLIICLLFTYGLFEMTFQSHHIPVVSDVFLPEDQDFTIIPLIKTVKPNFDKPVEQKKVKQSQNFEEVPDDTQLEVLVKTLVEPTVSTPDVNPSFTDLVDEPEDVELVDFIRVEIVPIYPGCEKKKTNDDKRKCMSEKITKLVQRKFNTGLGNELGLSGKQTIRTQFKIDKMGQVTDIKVKGTHAQLEKEAERVINKIPEMIPGKQRDKNVGVIYNLPIIFNVHN